MAEENGPGKSQDNVMQSLIGKQLRNLYDSVLVEPIPDKLVELLLKLDDVTSEGAPPGTSGNGEGTDRQ